MRKAFFILLFSGLLFAGNEIIQITVEVTEVNNNKARELGVKWVDSIEFGEVAWGMDKRSPEYLPEVPAIFETGDWARWTSLTAQLKLLQQKGAAKILSKPKLLTRSGTKAEFSVGGEFPVISGGVGGGEIEWKEYGIILRIKPEVVGDNKIKASIETEVSRLDWANKVDNYPAISTRRAKNNVVVRNGQTIAIAGLTETKQETQKTGLPILSDLPILGYLFGQEKVVEEQNTILIFITPEIVKGK